LNTRAFALILTLAPLLFLAGCGGDGSGGTTATGASKPGSAPGGEKSIEQFGQESGGVDRAEVLAAFQGYFDAVADGDYAAACAHLSATVKRSLTQIAEGRSGRASCATSLPKLLAPSAANSARQQAGGNVSKVRIQGGKAFVVYHAPGAKLYQLYLLREGGGWKATTLSGSILVPSL
jgi:hypothetical protein